MADQYGQPDIVINSIQDRSGVVTGLPYGSGSSMSPPMMNLSPQQLTADWSRYTQPLFSPFQTAGSMLGTNLYAPPIPPPMFNNSVSVPSTGGPLQAGYNAMFGQAPAYMTQNEYQRRNAHSAGEQISNYLGFTGMAVNAVLGADSLMSMVKGSGGVGEMLSTYLNKAQKPGSMPDYFGKFLKGTMEDDPNAGPMAQMVNQFLKGSAGVAGSVAGTVGKLAYDYSDTIVPLAMGAWDMSKTTTAMNRTLDKFQTQKVIEADSYRWFGRNGKGASREQAREMSNVVEDIASNSVTPNDDFGIKDILQNMQTGKFNDYMRGTKSIQEFKDKMKDLVSTAKDVAIAMGETVTQSMETVEDLKRIGFKDKTSMLRAIKEVAGVGNLTGRTGAEVLNIATQASAGLTGTGIDRSAAISPATHTMAALDIGQKAGDVSTGIVNALGGRDNVAATLASAQLAYFSKGARSKTAMAYAFDPATGQIDESKLNAALTGKIDPEDMGALAATNLYSPQARAKFDNRFSEMSEKYANRSTEFQMMSINQNSRKLQRELGLSADDATMYAARQQVREMGLSEDYAKPMLATLKRQEEARDAEEQEQEYVEARMDSKRQESHSGWRGRYARTSENIIRQKQIYMNKAKRGMEKIGDAADAALASDSPFEAASAAYHKPRFMEDASEVKRVMFYSGNARTEEFEGGEPADLTWGLVAKTKDTLGLGTAETEMAKAIAGSDYFRNNKPETVTREEAQRRNMVIVGASKTDEIRRIGIQMQKAGGILDPFLANILKDKDVQASIPGEFKNKTLSEVGTQLSALPADETVQAVDRAALQDYRTTLAPYLKEQSAQEKTQTNKEYMELVNTKGRASVSSDEMVRRGGFVEANIPASGAHVMNVAKAMFNSNGGSMQAAFNTIDASSELSSKDKEVYKKQLANDMDFAGLASDGRLRIPGSVMNMTRSEASKFIAEEEENIKDAKDAISGKYILSSKQDSALAQGIDDYVSGRRSDAQIAASLGRGNAGAAFQDIISQKGMSPDEMAKFRGARMREVKDRFSDTVDPKLRQDLKRLEERGAGMSTELKTTTHALLSNGMSGFTGDAASDFLQTIAKSSTGGSFQKDLDSLSKVDTHLKAGAQAYGNLIKSLGSGGAISQTDFIKKAEKSFGKEDAEGMASETFGTTQRANVKDVVSKLSRTSAARGALADQFGVNQLMAEGDKVAKEKNDKEFITTQTKMMKDASETFSKAAAAFKEIQVYMTKR